MSVWLGWSGGAPGAEAPAATGKSIQPFPSCGVNQAWVENNGLLKVALQTSVYQRHSPENTTCSSWLNITGLPLLPSSPLIKIDRDLFQAAAEIDPRLC